MESRRDSIQQWLVIFAVVALVIWAVILPVVHGMTNPAPSAPPQRINCGTLPPDQANDCQDSGVQP